MRSSLRTTLATDLRLQSGRANFDRAHRLGSKLDFGVVWTNCWMLRDLRTPFGGMKESGVGREGGLESLRFFTEPKSVFALHAARSARERS